MYTCIVAVNSSLVRKYVKNTIEIHNDSPTFRVRGGGRNQCRSERKGVVLCQDGYGVFAQQLFGYGRQGDVFLGISTSGNSQNVMNVTVVVRASGIKVIGLTGAKGGELSTVADVCVKVPETETYMIQELHLPIYHCWCLMLEDYFWGN